MSLFNSHSDDKSNSKDNGDIDVIMSLFKTILSSQQPSIKEESNKPDVLLRLDLLSRDIVSLSKQIDQCYGKLEVLSRELLEIVDEVESNVEEEESNTSYLSKNWKDFFNGL